MIRRIMVPLDGSQFGEQALLLAAALARQAGAALEVVHKHVPPYPLPPDSVLAREPGLGSQGRRQESAYLEEVVQRLRGEGLAEVSSALLDGPVVEALAEHAAKSGADLVVMTTHGRGPLLRFWLGSVADALIRKLPLPVILVHPHDESEEGEPAAAEPLPRRLLVPLDGSPHAERILGPAAELARLSGAELTLCRVVPPIPVLGHDLIGYAAGGTDVPLTETLRRDAAAYLDGLAGRLRAQGLRVHTRTLVDPYPASAVLGEAEGCDGIALETHGRGGLSRWLLGSVADKVVRGAHVPVLVHRSED
jgi:nucleotide-binding universal stress UspA family protein